MKIYKHTIFSLGIVIACFLVSTSQISVQAETINEDGCYTNPPECKLAVYGDFTGHDGLACDNRIDSDDFQTFIEATRYGKTSASVTKIEKGVCSSQFNAVKCARLGTRLYRNYLNQENLRKQAKVGVCEKTQTEYDNKAPESGSEVKTIIKTVMSKFDDSTMTLNKFDATTPLQRLGKDYQNNASSLQVFHNIDLPNDALILEAYLEFTVWDEGGKTVNVSVSVAKSGESSGPKNARQYRDLENMLSQTKIYWNNIPHVKNGEIITSPNLAPLLNAYRNQSSWESGNSLGFIIQDNQSDPYANIRYITNDFSGKGQKPTLRIKYLLNNGGIEPTTPVTPTLPSTVTLSPTLTPSPTNTPTPTITPSPSPTPTPSPTNTPSPTHTPSPTNTPTPTLTPSPSPTFTPSPTNTPTPSLTNTPSPTPTIINQYSYIGNIGPTPYLISNSSGYRLALSKQDNLYVLNSIGGEGYLTPPGIYKYNNVTANLDPLKVGFGIEVDQFENPSDITTDFIGNIYVANPVSNLIKTFSSNGEHIRNFKPRPNTSGNENYPYLLSTDSGGNIFVSEMGSNLIRKYTSSGVYQNDFYTPSVLNGKIPTAVDSQNNVYIGDYGKLVKLNSDGQVLNTITSYNVGSSTKVISRKLTFIPDIAVDSSDNVYVLVNIYPGLFIKLDKFMNFIGVYQIPSGGCVASIDVNLAGSIYATGFCNTSVVRLDPIK